MMNRREAIARLGAMLGAGWLGTNAAAQSTTTTQTPAAATPATTSPFTFAHITDVHIIDQYDSEKWVAKALHQIQSHPAKPQLIINTGDCIMDSLNKSKQQSLKWWKLWNDTFRRENSLPMHTAIGNHDVWGGRLKVDTPHRNDPLFGKQMALEQLGMEKSYFHFDAGHWRFIILDSIYPIQEGNNRHWTAKLGDEQLDWLKKTIRDTPKNRNIVIGSHIPILQVVSLWNAKRDDKGNLTMSHRAMMTDNRELTNLFAQHPNVKLCLSGHIHQLDRVQLHHATYVCGGALSGAKWNRVKPHVPNGFGIVTLQPDGKIDYQYEPIGWELPKKT